MDWHRLRKDKMMIKADIRINVYGINGKPKKVKNT
jgi:hypothetical protein